MREGRYKQWITQAGQEQIKAWVKQGLNDRQIADEIGVSKALLSRWRRTHSEIRTALMRPIKIGDALIEDSHELPQHKRARKLTSARRVQKMIDTWMDETKEAKKPLTITSLCLYLHISAEQFDIYAHDKSRDSEEAILSPFDGKDHLLTIADCLKRARLAIENSLVEWAITHAACSGAIFVLKNHYGYADKQEIGGISGKPLNIADERKLTGEQLDSKIKALLDKNHA